MFSNKIDLEHILLGLMVMVPATIGAIAALRNGKQARKTRDEFRDMVDDGNGGKRLGIAVHDIAQNVEFLAAQNHTNTSEILAIAAKLDTHADLLKDHIGDAEELREEYLKIRPVLLGLAKPKDDS